MYNALKDMRYSKIMKHIILTPNVKSHVHNAKKNNKINCMGRKGYFPFSIHVYVVSQ